MSAPGSLSLQGVGKRFGSTAALHDFSLEFEPGGITTLLGPSGCGKTTALRIIAGFLDPEQGDVLLDGRSLLGRQPFRRDTALVFQDFALFPHMDVARNVGYGLGFRGIKGEAARQRVAAMLEFLELDRFAQRMPHELSGGQQQRVALGRALAVQPRVLLMDEPLSNLDARLRAHLRSELKSIQHRLGVTTVFVTHDQEEALTLSDRIAVMREGRLVQAGAPRELFELPLNRFVADVLGDADFLPVSSAVRDGPDVVATVLGRKVRARAAPGPLPGDPLLMVRPGWWSSGPAAPGDLSLRATVQSVDYLGTFERLWLKVDDFAESAGLVRMDAVTGGAPFTASPGERIDLVLPAARSVLVSASQ